MSVVTDGAAPLVVAVGDNSTLLWGMTAAERLRRICAARKLALDDTAGGPALIANLHFVFDPAWMPWFVKRPGTVLTRGDIPVLAHAADDAQRAAITAAMEADRPLPSGTGLDIIAAEDEQGIFNEALRKRERPFAELLVPANVPRIERATYIGAYKGVTDLLTKYLWPEWAFALTRLATQQRTA